MRDFTSFLKNFDLMKSIERNNKSKVNAVPIRSINESEVISNNGPALNDTASAIPRIIMLKVQLPIMSPYAASKFFFLQSAKVAVTSGDTSDSLKSVKGVTTYFLFLYLSFFPH